MKDADLIARSDKNHDDLSNALTWIAEARGLAKPEAQGAAVKRNILRAIENKKADKLREQHSNETYKRWQRQIGDRPTLEWAIVLVRHKHCQEAGKTGTNANLSSLSSQQLSPVEKRAVELLRGAKSPSKKNPVEERAIRLVSAIRRDWFPATLQPPVNDDASHIDVDSLLIRDRTADALTAAGYPTASATLATLASRGGGPPFRKYGPRPLYRWGDALKWAQSRLSGPVRSTSELRRATAV